MLSKFDALQDVTEFMRVKMAASKRRGLFTYKRSTFGQRNCVRQCCHVSSRDVCESLDARFVGLVALLVSYTALSVCMHLMTPLASRLYDV
jgi:hypothetical protein